MGEIKTRGKANPGLRNKHCLLESYRGCGISDVACDTKVIYDLM